MHGSKCVGIRRCGCPRSCYVGQGISYKRCWLLDNGITYAEKSADPVAARVASEERRACQTAPLWPMNVPILLLVSDVMNLRVMLDGPVASNTISQHWVVIFTSGDEVVLIIFED